MADGDPRIAMIPPRLAGIGGLELYCCYAIKALLDWTPLEIITDEPADPAILRERFGIDIPVERLSADPRCAHEAHLGGRVQRAWAAVRGEAFTQATRRFDLVLTNSFVLPPRSGARRSILFCHFPTERRYDLVLPERPSLVAGLLSARAREERQIRRQLDSWRTIVSNSEYTRRWVRQVWQRESEVIHPPVPVPAFVVRQRRPVIVAAGLFARPREGQMGFKRHELLIDAFRALVEGGTGDWTLHLAGHLGPDRLEAQSYVEELRRRARGLDVEFHPDYAHEQFMRLLSTSSVFWHAAGFEEDLETHPERADSFGMVTAEAAAHGCVPVVIRAGGQPEIVDSGVNGFLWDSLSELLESTRALIDDPALLTRFSQAAAQDARRFSYERFEREVRDVVSRELATLGWPNRGARD